jgi:hypothetical protein
MEKSIQLKTNQLTVHLVEGLKKYFESVKTEEVTISFSVPDKTYLRKETQEETNSRIEKAIENIGKGNSVSFSEEEFLALSTAITSIK